MSLIQSHIVSIQDHQRKITEAVASTPAAPVLDIVGYKFQANNQNGNITFPNVQVTPQQVQELILPFLTKWYGATETPTITTSRGGSGKRVMSAAARAKISRAAKARWAKVRGRKSSK